MCSFFTYFFFCAYCQTTQPSASTTDHCDARVTSFHSAASFMPQSCRTNVSPDSSHLNPLSSSSSPLLSPPGLCRPSFLSSAWLVDSWRRSGSPPPLPGGLNGAALELEAPRPSSSLTCPQRGAAEVRGKARAALLGERLQAWRFGLGPALLPQ